MASCVSLLGFLGIRSQTTGATYSGRSSRDFPLWTIRAASFSRDYRAHLWSLPSGIRSMDVLLDGAVEIGFADIDGRNR